MKNSVNLISNIATLGIEKLLELDTIKNFFSSNNHKVGELLELIDKSDLPMEKKYKFLKACLIQFKNEPIDETVWNQLTYLLSEA